MDSMERQREEERLAAIRELINRQIAHEEYSLADSEHHLADINADLWENVHHQIYDLDDVVEYQQRHMEMALHANMAHRSHNQLRVLDRMLDSPYFGRIDFLGPRQASPAEIYIGINSVFAEGEIRPRIYDWRAPISSMFYDFGTGRASYQSPSGKIEGTVSLKRQYKIRGGKFEYLFDSDVKIDDEILQRELSMHAEGRLRTIVSSIQKEQNDAIRAGTHDNLIVFGAAGSGKTSVGLHRLAYHLYQDRGHITSANILVFAQNDVFSSYISDIIPELGEEDVTRLSFNQLIRGQFGQGRALQDSSEQTEYFIGAPAGDGRLRAIEVKYSTGFLDYIKETVARMEFTFGDIVFFRQTICTGEELTGRVRSDGKGFSPYVKLKRLIDFAGERLADFFITHGDEIKEFLLSRMVDAKELDRELQLLLEDTKAKAARSLKAQADLNAERIYLDALKGYLDERGMGEGVYSATAGQLTSGSLYYEDALGMLYVRLLTGEIEPNRAIRHVLIDEAQDFSILQHRIIRLMTAGSKYTVLADVEQAMFPVINIRDRRELQAIYGGRTVELTRSYRSTRQISDLAVKLLDHRGGEYFDRSGAKPAVLFVHDAARAVRRLLDGPECRGCRSVGIITKTARQAEELFKQIGGGVGIVSKGTDTFTSGTVVIPVSLAKGLEFDCVILPDCSARALSTPQDKRILYLMCTRALHRLYLLCPGELTGFLAPFDDLYEVLQAEE